MNIDNVIVTITIENTEHKLRVSRSYSARTAKRWSAGENSYHCLITKMLFDQLSDTVHELVESTTLSPPKIDDSTEKTPQ